MTFWIGTLVRKRTVFVLQVQVQMKWLNLPLLLSVSSVPVLYATILTSLSAIRLHHYPHDALWHYLSHWPRSTGRSRFTLPVTCSPCCMSIIPMSLKTLVHARTHVPSCRSRLINFYCSIAMQPVKKMIGMTFVSWNFSLVYSRTAHVKIHIWSLYVGTKF